MSDPIVGDFVPLTEKAVRRDGTIQVKVIGEGWGSSGYYSRDVLERDIPRAFPAGTHMYWNHPSMTEAEERPERDLRDLAAVTINDPRWMEAGPAGPGMYADARVFSGYRETVDEIAEHIGASIRGAGKVQQGEAAGKTGPIVEEISDGLSVDFVTAPGAGGAIVSIFESAPDAGRLPEPGDEPGESTPPEAAEESAGQTPGKEYDVSELQEAQAARDKAQADLAEAQRQLEEERAERKKLRETLVLREARDFVAGQVAETDLPEMTAERIVREVAANPILADGALDEDAMAERVEKRIKEAEAEVAAILGFNGRVEGQGHGPANGDGPSLEEARKRTDAALAEIGYGGNS